MKLKKIISSIFLLVTLTFLAQETITSGRLSVTINNLGDGISIASIKDDGTEVLNTAISSDLFTLYIVNSTTDTDEILTATTGWTSLSITNNGDNAVIVLNNPTNINLPDSLTTTISIESDNEKSSWDIAVTGLGVDCSLIDVIFPQLNIKADGNDTFFYPLYSGQLTENPGTEIDYFNDTDDIHDNLIGTYPRGWGTTMQFLSYYNANYGLYFGFHDPDASLKDFGVKNENGGIRIQCKIPVADKTINGNDWEMSGYFELDLYNGDWFDAALLYKEWASTSASYWPQESAEHTARQHSVGDIGAWITTHMATDGTVAENQTYIQLALDFYDFPVGVHIYEWNNFEHDHFYPTFFPEQDNLDAMISNIQDTNDALIMPYINGRMWDTGVGGDDDGDAEAVIYFNNEGFEDATKHSDGSFIEDFPFEGNTFAIMCPTQSNWQSIITDAADQLTNSNRLGSKAVYLDMVSASAAAQCMDTSHNHTLGGGSYWRDGYKQMFQSIHTTIPTDDFITVEGGCDFLVDEVDAFMVQGWQTRNQVPGWQVIYTNKVQLFGTATHAGMYGDQRFYGRLSQGFAYGVQTGRQFIWLSINSTQNPDKEMAANYVRSLGRMRYKLRNFMSYGEMKRPIDISGAIPEITYEIHDWGGSRGNITITNPAIRKTVWQNANEVVVVFVNGRIQSPAGVEGGNISFEFDFNPNDYGLTGDLTIQEITPTLDGDIAAVDDLTFPKEVNLQNLELVAYKITGDASLSLIDDNKVTLSIFPNPTKDSFKINYDFNDIEYVKLYNSLGQLVLTTIPENKTVDISKVTKGFYVVSIQTTKKEYVSKLLKE
jgi:hypothetical protein